MRSLGFIPGVLMAGVLSGCAAQGVSPEGKIAAVRTASLKRMDPVRIQADTMGFADRFVTGMSGVYDELEKHASTAAAKDAAHQLKTDLALGAISDAVNPRPIAGLIDMGVLVTLLRQIAEDPWTTRTFGADAPRLVQALKRQEADMRAMASQYLTDAQLAELDGLAAKWHVAHPDERSVSHVHLADLPEANGAPKIAARQPSSVFGLLFFDPTAELDPAVREIELSRATSERMFFYLQRLPLLLQLQSEAFYRQLFAVPQVARSLDNLSAMAASSTRFADASNRFADALARFPDELSEQRRQALAEASSELTKQRDAAIRQLKDAIAGEREAAIAEATTRMSSQRDETIRQSAAVFRQEQEGMVDNVEAATNRSMNRLFLGLAALGVFAAVLTLATALATRRVRGSDADLLRRR